MNNASGRWIVVIPAKNEERRLPNALAALDRAAARSPVPVSVLVLANNCDDATAPAAQRAARGARFDMVVQECDLPAGRAHAGGARAHAVAAARRVFGAGRADRLLSTDADARVSPDALALAGTALSGGADIVLARILCHADGDDPAPEAALRRRAAVVAWRRKVRAVVEWLCTGRPVAPGFHGDHGAAGIAATFAAYDAAGGFPPVPADEDRRFVAAADALGLRVDRSCGFAVHASTRVHGRALGGMAEALRRHAIDTQSVLVERHDLTLARLCVRPCHSQAFVDRPASLEPVDHATAGLQSFLAGTSGRAA